MTNYIPINDMNLISELSGRWRRLIFFIYQKFNWLPLVLIPVPQEKSIFKYLERK